MVHMCNTVLATIYDINRQQMEIARIDAERKKMDIKKEEKN